MSERLDAVLAALDVGLQDSPESHVYSDVAPTIHDECVRCQHRDRFEESDFCEGCRAFLLGDGDDPMVWSPVPSTCRDPLCTERGHVHLEAGTLDIGIRRDSSIPGPRNDLRIFAEEWVSVARVGAEDVSWTLEAGGVPHEYAEEWRRLGVGPMPCPNRYARPVVHHRDGNRWNNTPENLTVVDPRENITAELRGASADALNIMRDAVESYAHRNRMDDTERAQVQEMALSQDLIVWGEAFTDEDGNRIPPNEVRIGILVDPENPDLSQVEPFCRDDDGNVALRWSPPLGTGDPLTDPVAAAREHVERRLAEYNASLPQRVPFPPVGSYPIGDCPRCTSGEPVDVGIMRDADFMRRNEVGVFVDHASGPCERGGTMTVPQFHSQRGH